MHPNSIEAFDDLDVKTRREIVRKVYEQRYPSELTDREVMTILGFTDPNRVRPRITELKQQNKIVEVRKIYDPETRSSVRKCKAKVIEKQLLLV
jgi:hypothetical protein